MTSPLSNPDHRKRFPVVGRDSRVDLAKYTVRVHGQDIIDYEKLKADNPALYKEIVAREFEADRKQSEELEEILAAPATELTPDLLKSLQSVVIVEQPATAKYFYLPVFVSNPRKSSEGKYEIDVLTFANHKGLSMTYASRVLPGQTLAEAVAYDLQKDFRYGGDFQIWAHYFYDESPDKHGNSLPRIAVLVKVDTFSTSALHPAGMEVHWSADGVDRLREYRFEVA